MLLQQCIEANVECYLAAVVVGDYEIYYATMLGESEYTEVKNALSSMDIVDTHVADYVNQSELKNCIIYKIYDAKAVNIEEILYSYNSKEILQQYTQGKNKDLPEYEIINETGKAHNKTYEICVKYRGEELGRGKAKTKKEAEKSAAFEAIKRLKGIPCGYKNTSCPDQLAIALQEIKEKKIS